VLPEECLGIGGMAPAATCPTYRNDKSVRISHNIDYINTKELYIREHVIMRPQKLGYQLDGWKAMDLRVSASTIAVANVTVPLTVAGRIECDDPLPEPEPPPSYPGDEPPIEYPVTPPSGPGGPGS
jgi:hypothetical protein